MTGADSSLEIVKEFVESKVPERLSTGLFEQPDDSRVSPVVKCTMEGIIVQNKKSKTAREETQGLLKKPATSKETASKETPEHLKFSEEGCAGSGLDFVLQAEVEEITQEPDLDIFEVDKFARQPMVFWWH